MTTTREYLEAQDKVNGWVIDQQGRTETLCWRCWRLDEDDPFTNRQMSFATRQEGCAVRFLPQLTGERVDPPKRNTGPPPAGERVGGEHHSLKNSGPILPTLLVIL